VKILLLDNYDSFTFNLYHYLQIGGAEVEVFRNDDINEQAMQMISFDGAVLSPGPATPEKAGKLMEFIALHAGVKPILGVCLGMQGLGLHYGWNLTTAKMPRHGKSSLIEHNASGIFTGIPNPMQAARYHSLIIEKTLHSRELQEEAWCGDEIMAVSGSGGKVWGVQFHPESILTPQGQLLINNWLGLLRV
jgi:anthranilate synthase component II